MRCTADWIIPDWPAPPRVKSLITTRNGGESRGPFSSFNLGFGVGDDPEAVRNNRARLRHELPQEPRWLKQRHGARVVEADSITLPIEADASVARHAGTVCAVLVADCLPVLLTDRAGTVVAAVHAGWRGLARGVIENTVEAMKAPASEILAYLGPAIGPEAFEVGTEVRDVFLAKDSDAATAFVPRRQAKWLADIYLLARQVLARCGVTRVYGGSFCTVSDGKRFFSYRRDRTTGRMAALIWRVE